MDRIMIGLRRYVHIHQDSFRRIFDRDIYCFMNIDGFALDRFLLEMECPMDDFEHDLTKRFGKNAIHIIRHLCSMPGITQAIRRPKMKLTITMRNQKTEEEKNLEILEA